MNYVILRSTRLLGEFKTFVNVNGSRIADHRRSFHDDSIMSLAMGLYVLNFDTRRFKKNDNDKTKKMLNAILTTNDMNNIKEKYKQINKGFNRKVVPYGFNPNMDHNWLFKP